jgi:SP family arabinose:H+ symporter-like MFS transporter
LHYVCFSFNYFRHYIVLISVLIYVSAFGCTLGAVTWVYLSEIFPNTIRSLALSIAILALWLADFVVAYTFPMLSGSLGIAAILLVYAVFCLWAFIYSLLKLPETKGKILEGIESIVIKNQ